MGHYSLEVLPIFESETRSFEDRVKLEGVKKGEIEIQINMKAIHPIRSIVAVGELFTKCKENEKLDQN